MFSGQHVTPSSDQMALLNGAPTHPQHLVVRPTRCHLTAGDKEPASFTRPTHASNHSHRTDTLLTTNDPLQLVLSMLDYAPASGGQQPWQHSFNPTTAGNIAVVLYY